jgi:hypothetical protein
LINKRRCHDITKGEECRAKPETRKHRNPSSYIQRDSQVQKCLGMWILVQYCTVKTD